MLQLGEVRREVTGCRRWVSRTGESPSVVRFYSEAWPASAWRAIFVNIQVPYGGLRLTTNSDGPGSRKHTYVRFTCSPPEHLPTSRLHNVIFELDSDTLRA